MPDIGVIEILERLLVKARGTKRYSLRASGWFDDHERNTPATRALWKDFLRHYREAVREVTRTWGPPEFEGGWEDKAFPAWHHWVARLAYWRRGDAVAYIECDHPDPETPMLLSLGAKAREELEGG